MKILSPIVLAGFLVLISGCEKNTNQDMLVKCRKANITQASINMESGKFKQLYDDCKAFVSAQENLCAYSSEEEKTARNNYEASLNEEALKGFKEICGSGLFDTKNVVDGIDSLTDKVSSGVDSMVDGINSAAESISEKFSSDDK
jgi:ribosomal protein L7/L12